MGRGWYDTWRQLPWRPYGTIASTLLPRYSFVLTDEATFAKSGILASRCCRSSCDRQQGTGSATGELMAGDPENCHPPGINTASELSERRGEHTPGAMDEMADERGSSFRGCLSWESGKRTSSSRLASGHEESESCCPC